MVEFLGYKKKPDPKWPYLLIPVLIILILFVLSSLFGWLSQNVVSPTIKNIKSAFTAQKPVNSNLSTTEVVANIAEQGTIKEVNGITIEVEVFTSSISGNTPTDSISSISTNNSSRLYFYNKISSSILPTTLKHVWINPSEKIVASIPIDLKRSPANIWSYLTLVEKELGEWTVQIQTVDGTVISEKKIILE